MSQFEEELECIDARVFSSDLLQQEQMLEILKKYVERWARAIAEEKRAKAEFWSKK